MTDENPAEPTVLSRLLAAPLSQDRIEEHFRAGRVLLNGEPVGSLDDAAPAGTRIHFGPS